MAIRADLQQRLTEAQEAGMCLCSTSESDDRRLRAACTRGDLLSPFRHVYVDSAVWNDLKPNVRELFRLRAIATLHPNWVFADVSAALIHGFAVSYSLLGRVHILTAPRSHSRSNKEIKRHLASTVEETKIDGIRVTSATRTAFDCLRTYGFRESLAVGDSVLRICEMTNDQLANAFDAYNRSHVHKTRAIQIAELCNGRAENGGESIARAVMIEQGFQIPSLQVEVPNIANPADPYRVDFFWQLEDTRVAGELDGREKYRNPKMTKGRDVVDVMADERLRESRISATGVRIMRFSYADVINAQKFCMILRTFGIPSGYEVPEVALPKR